MSSSKSVGLSCVSVGNSTSDSKILVSCFRSILCFRSDLKFRRVITMGGLFSKKCFLPGCVIDLCQGMSL